MYITTEYTKTNKLTGKTKTVRFTDAQIYAQSETLCSLIDQQSNHRQALKSNNINRFGQFLDKISLVSFLSGFIFLFVDFDKTINDPLIALMVIVFAFAVSIILAIAGYATDISYDEDTQMYSNYGELKALAHMIALLPAVTLITIVFVSLI